MDLDTIDIVFDGPPSHASGRFVEVENSEGKSINFGEWVHRDDGYWVLRFRLPFRAESAEAERDTRIRELEEIEFHAEKQLSEFRTELKTLQSRLALAEKVIKRAKTYRGRDADLDEYIRPSDAALKSADAPKEGVMTCTHDLAERETACADGMCPICLAAGRRPK